MRRYAIGSLRLDVATATLSDARGPLPVGPRVVATLAALVERAGEVVTKDELLDSVWGGDDVGESNVAQSVYVLRKVFREHELGAPIATVPRRGYRWIGEAVPLPDVTPTATRPVRRSVRTLAACAALALAVVVGFAAARPAPRTPALSARGAELYRLGRYYWAFRTPVALAKSVALFTEVTHSDPRSPLGWAGLADADLMIADYERAHVSTALYYRRAADAVAAALARDPSSVAARTSHAMLLEVAQHDRLASEAEYRHAIALDPSYALAHLWYGAFLVEHGRVAEGERQLRVAVSLDPVSPAASAWLGETAYYERRFGEVIAYARRALEFDPTRADALRSLGLGYEESGDVPRAIGVFKQLGRVNGGEGKAAALLAEAYARLGRFDEARAALRVAQRLQPKEFDTKVAALALADRQTARSLLATLRAQEPGEPRLLRYTSS
jgi:DNA-binding winged helix-turn-helix (wHTH) protein/tetratricopeptide (TPR) repeat protein